MKGSIFDQKQIASLPETQRQKIEKRVIGIISFWPVIMSVLQQIPGMPDMIKYVADALLIGIVALTIIRGEVIIRQKILPLVVLIVLFFGVSLIGFLAHYQSPFYYAWGLRNNFRFFIAFIMYVNCTREEDTDQWFRALEWIFWINALLSLIQFIFFGIKQDRLGGIFGTTGGTNGATQALLMIIICRTLLLAFNGMEATRYSVLKCVTALIIAAMAELKFFYVVFLAELVIVAVMTRFSWKKVAMLAVCGLGISITASMLVIWFGFENFLSIENILEKAFRQNYSTANDLNRFSAIGSLSERFMPGIGEKLFGLGLGNCDTSAISLFNSAFFSKYSYLHYSWFTAPMIFLETGYVGLLVYGTFFVACFVLARKQLKTKKGNELYCQMVLVLIPIYGVVAFYNASLRTEPAYLLYFILALPFIQRRKQLEMPVSDMDERMKLQ